ncbi:hypothetical protein [Mycolicibacterium peregrinum]|uniref:Uncharacterized protein n=1 Tax=Mycolicibacterium peregrinum TaxID=43304 RepID=A0A1A0VCD6_MYCPR|nr:hypothetical protein [Mycolicibacterium peregrinum]OBB80903.1 hypothetical protein A5779_10810 [Mycolicibacterium peregrinum]
MTRIGEPERRAGVLTSAALVARAALDTDFRTTHDTPVVGRRSKARAPDAAPTVCFTAPGGPGNLSEVVGHGHRAHVVAIGGVHDLDERRIEAAAAPRDQRPFGGVEDPHAVPAGSVDRAAKSIHIHLL